MSKSKAEFVTACITTLVVLLVCLCWKISAENTMYFIYLLAVLGLFQFAQGTERFLMAPEREKKKNAGRHE